MRTTGPKLPPIAAGADLVAAINDRLRRIEGMNGAATTGAAPAARPAPTEVVTRVADVQITDQTLTADTTISAPSTSAAGLWVARIGQDLTGGWKVTWGAGIAGGPQIDSTVNSAPLTMCVLIFAAVAGEWLLCATPILGVPIS
jgi:hypothetical protein